jgi:hypothetical protein
MQAKSTIDEQTTSVLGRALAPQLYITHCLFLTGE